MEIHEQTLSVNGLQTHILTAGETGATWRIEPSTSPSTLVNSMNSDIVFPSFPIGVRTACNGATLGVTAPGRACGLPQPPEGQSPNQRVEPQGDQ